MALALSSCSIDISQQISTGSDLAQTGQSRKKVPVTWRNMNLQGGLVYITSSFGSVNGGMATLIHVELLDLASGNITTVFDAPAGDWIDFVSVSPDGKQLAMEYLPAADDVSSGSRQELLYAMPMDASQQPRLLLPPPTRADLYYQPTWSPDGRYIYFSHVDLKAAATVAGQTYPNYELSRMAYPDGQIEILLDHAFWPRLSPDGSQLAYVSVDPVDGSNRLFAAHADGSGSHEVTLSGPYIPKIIDAPFFSADNRTIFFSAASPVTSLTPTWVDQFFGITVASAHVVPSDLWFVPANGGRPTQLTRLAALGLDATPAPDGQHVALYTGRGIFVMDADGGNLTAMVNDTGGIPGSVSWIH